MAVSKSTRDRVHRGIILATSGAVKAHGDLWIVQGFNGNGWTVNLDAETCQCPDYRKRQQPCKHVYAAQVVDSREACRRKKSAKPKRIRHDGQGLRGIVADMNRLDEVAGRLGV